MRREHTGVFKTADGRYGVDYRTPDGHRHHYIVGSKQLAINIYRARMAEIFEQRYRPQPPTRMTFAELATMNLKRKRGRIQELSYCSDRQRTRELVNALGPYLIDEITPPMVDALLSKLRNSGLEGSTCNRYRAALSSAFSYAVDMELLAKNPVKKVPKYPESEGRTRRLQADERPALFEAVRRLHPQREPELVLLLHTGLRKNGMFQLRWQDVDLDRAQITVVNKGGGTYRVELNSLAVAALRELHAKSGGREKVCQSRAYWSSTDWLEECIKAAGIEDFTPHDLRHTFGSEAIEAGADLVSVQLSMGHRNIQTTRKRYVHLSTAHIKTQLEKMVSNTTPVMDSQKDTSTAEIAQVIELKAVNK